MPHNTTMFFIFIFVFLTSSFAAIIRPRNKYTLPPSKLISLNKKFSHELKYRRPPDAIDGDNCNIIQERKTLNVRVLMSHYLPPQQLISCPKWNFLSTNGSKPDPINRYNLTAPGAGYVWRGEDFSHPDVSRPILFQYSQGWSLVNCSSYFPESHPARGAVSINVPKSF